MSEHTPERTADDVLRSNECNTYVLSCHLSSHDLYKAIRQDLRIACAEIAKLRAEREEQRAALKNAEQFMTSIYSWAITYGVWPVVSGFHANSFPALLQARAALAEKGE